MSDPRNRTPNRLAKEKSPYLLQHAYNPVDWYPWGPEAFEKARREDKPILLSIGYSTCHWCHVMERESFEDPAVAEVMNRHLVCIKLDREERPDVDKIYMTAVSAMTGSGGWPLNAFLTPDLKPFFGGTYFPPDARYGRMGWPQVVERVGQAWRDPESRRQILESGETVLKGVAQYLASPAESDEAGDEAVDGALAGFRDSFDAERGGFGHAPKFPMPVNLGFLLRCHARRKSPEALEMVLATLRAMAKGGIYDHVGGGFSRYSTDERWHVPHFEKMLYDNAQLAVVYLDAAAVSGDASLARVARETLDYVRRDMTHPDGAFYSAEDADSFPEPGAAHKAEGAPAHGAGTVDRPKAEGAFYVWTREEVLERLGVSDGELFGFRYGVEAGGNVEQDPHGEFTNKNVLYEARSLEECAAKFGRSVEETGAALDRARAALRKVREGRPRPHLDDKVLSAWNGLMISAFARGAQALGEPGYAEAAVRAAAFLKDRLWDASAKTLYRRWRDGERRVPGVADDYAFLAQGALDLYETVFDPAWLAWAEELADLLLKKFYDAEHGGFFMTAEGHDEHLLLRVREEADNVEPSAASVAALTLLRLSAMTGRADFRAAAEKTLLSFGPAMKFQPRLAPAMLSTLLFSMKEPSHIVLAGDPASSAFRALAETVHRRFLPDKVLLAASAAGRLPQLAALAAKGGPAAAYVCANFACRAPAADPAAFARELDAL